MYDVMQLAVSITGQGMFKRGGWRSRKRVFSTIIEVFSRYIVKTQSSLLATEVWHGWLHIAIEKKMISF